MYTRPIRPLRDRVLVRADPPESLSAGGIVLLDSYHHDSGKRSSWRGEVLSVGPEVRAPELVPGAQVVFERRGGDWLEGAEGDDRVKALPESIILGVLEG